MQPTVREILELPGPAGRVNRRSSVPGRWTGAVRWVHVSESADLSNLLEGGELVLTTGLGPARRAAPGRLPSRSGGGRSRGCDRRTRPAHRRGAGIGARVGRIARTARDRAAPPVRFVDVTEEVHRRIVAEQYAEVDYARRVHETFTASEHAPGVAERDRRSGRRNARVRTGARRPQPSGAGLRRAWHADHGTARRLGPPVPAHAVRRARRLAEPPGRPVPPGMGPVDRADRREPDRPRRDDGRTLRAGAGAASDGRTGPHLPGTSRAERPGRRSAPGAGRATRPRPPRVPTPWVCVRRSSMSR